MASRPPHFVAERNDIVFETAAMGRNRPRAPRPEADAMNDAAGWGADIGEGRAPLGHWLAAF